jgi:hypothetical protein
MSLAVGLKKNFKQKKMIPDGKAVLSEERVGGE